ncbi:MAG: alanine/glycine:cation symporter family protein, partial [Gammaproteobacteria bacterium]
GLLAVGVLFTLWSRFGQWRSLTHGLRLLAGRVPGISGYGAGALSHFQALSAALSATVGLGNIGGVAIAVSIGGPGAVFWMWMVGFVGMAIKATEVTLALLYRDTSQADNPHGGTMWVCKKGFAELSPALAKAGAVAGGLFAVALILFGLTGANMFQAWNVAEITRSYFGVPSWISGLICAVVVGAVILGGIKRIGAVAGLMVPLMCAIYVICGLGVLIAEADQLPAMFRLIFACAFSETEGAGAFTGATLGVAFIFGMKRALFSSEAGMGSAPIAHSAVKTPEPVTEGVVAGLEPFIDTLIVCTMTALVILVSGVWQRGPAAVWETQPALAQSAPNQWQPSSTRLPEGRTAWNTGDQVFVVVETSAGRRARLYGEVIDVAHAQRVKWRPLRSAAQPRFAERGIFVDYPAATLTAIAFDSAFAGLGQWMVTLVVWLFAISTMIAWSYYGEQGVIYLFGARWVTPYRWLWCALIFVACLGFIRTDYELDTISTVALGFMLAVNLPTMVILGSRAMHAWRDYFERLDAGQIGASREPSE